MGIIKDALLRLEEKGVIEWLPDFTAYTPTPKIVTVLDAKTEIDWVVEDIRNISKDLVLVYRNDFINIEHKQYAKILQILLKAEKELKEISFAKGNAVKLPGLER